MSLKFCFQNEIHRITKVPQDFVLLLKSLQEVFSTTFPSKFTVEYQDAEGDRIIIHNDDDYKLALESEFNNGKTLKIFLTDATELDNVSFITKESIALAQNQDEKAQMIQSKTTSFEILAEIKEPAAPVAVERKSLTVVIPETKNKSTVLEVQNTEILTTEQSPAEVKSGVAVLNVQKAEPQSGVAVLNIQKAEPQSGVAVLEIQKAEPQSGVAVLSIQKTEPLSGVAVLEVQKSEPLSGVAVLEVQKSEPLSGVAVLEVQKSEPLSGVAVLEVQKSEPLSCVAVLEVQKSEPLSGVAVLEVQKSEPLSGVAVLEVQKAEPLSGVAVLEVQKSEPLSGVAVLDVQKTEPRSAVSVVSVRKVEPNSGISVVSVQKSEPRSAVSVVSVRKVEPNSGVSVLNVQKGEPRSAVSVVSVRKVKREAPSSAELDSGVSVVGVYKAKGKTAKKAKKMQRIAKESLYQEMPSIAVMIKDLLEEPKTKNRAVHSSVICNICKAFPIIGDRFKCTVLENYDLCSHCEKTVDHPFPLIKIRDESQYPYLSAFFTEDPAFSSELSKKQQKKNKKIQKRQNELEDLVGGLLKQLEQVSGNDANCFTDLASELITNFTEVLEKPLLKAETKNNNEDFNNIVDGFMKQLEQGANFIGDVANAVIGQTQESQYSSDIVKKVKEILEVFPQIDFKNTCKYVAQNQDKSLEEMVLDFIPAF